MAWSKHNPTGADKRELKHSNESEITIETQTHSISCRQFVFPAVIRACLAHLSYYLFTNCNLYSLSTKKHQIICESKWHCWHTMHSGPQLTAIVCPTIGPNTLQPMPYQLCSTGAPLETIHKANVTVDGSCREAWKCSEEAAVAVEHLLATWPSWQQTASSGPSTLYSFSFYSTVLGVDWKQLAHKKAWPRTGQWTGREEYVWIVAESNDKVSWCFWLECGSLSSYRQAGSAHQSQIQEIEHTVPEWGSKKRRNNWRVMWSGQATDPI